MSDIREYRFAAVLTQAIVTMLAFWLLRHLSQTTADYYAGAVGCTISLTFYFWLKLTGVERLATAQQGNEKGETK